MRKTLRTNYDCNGMSVKMRLAEPWERFTKDLTKDLTSPACSIVSLSEQRFVSVIANHVYGGIETII